MKNLARLLIVIAIALSTTFAAEPQPTKQPDTAFIEQLQKQVESDKAEIARKDQVIAALREQMQALSAYFSAQEKIRALEMKPANAVSTSAPSAQKPDRD